MEDNNLAETEINNIPEHSGTNQNLKRKTEVEDVIVCKKRKLEPGSQDDNNNLLTFSDDLLLIILKNLDHHDIVALSQTCDRLNQICHDHTLWREVHFPNPTSTFEISFMARNIGIETRSVLTKGHHEPGKEFQDTFSSQCMSLLCDKCPNLIYLSMTSHFIDCKHIGINNYPSSLIKLDLSATSLRNEPQTRSYFKDISLLMPQLEVLILSNCKWFEPHSLMALSKCPHLKELYLDGCVKIKDCVAYCGLATRGGFKSLKTLDLRRCPIGSSELICFASVTSIVNLYLENPMMEDDVEGPFIDPPIFILFTNEPMIEIRAVGHQGNITYPRIKVEKLIIRNYLLMTDDSLSHLARDALHLKYLDVTGSSVSSEAIRKFKESRPEVWFVH